MKKLISMLLVLALVLSLAACGSEDTQSTGAPETTQPTQAAEPETSEEQTVQPIAQDPEAYMGFYKMPDGFLEIYWDGTFACMDNEGEIYASGVCRFEEGVTLVSDGGETAFFVLDQEGNLYGGEDYGTFYRIEEENVDGPNGFIPAEFVNDWYLFGDLTLETLVIFYDGSWQLRTGQDGEDSRVICEGTSFPGEGGELFLQEGDREVGFATIADGWLTLVLTMDYEWVLEDYASGGLVFQGIEDCVPQEPQGLYWEPYQGYWLYDSGYVLQLDYDLWYLYDNGGTLLNVGPVEYDEEAAWLMNEDGSSGGGKLYFDEEGNAFESGTPVTWAESFPWGSAG